MTKSERSTNLVRLALIGGLAGGAAEVLWVLFYSGLSEVNAVVVAREVTASLWPAAATWSIAPLLGVATHMVLALALAALCAPVLLRIAVKHEAPAAIMVAAVGALAAVWAVNFFLVLPLLNPAFIALMPYPATLVSKMLFGVAMAAVVRRAMLPAATHAHSASCDSTAAPELWRLPR